MRGLEEQERSWILPLAFSGAMIQTRFLSNLQVLLFFQGFQSLEDVWQTRGAIFKRSLSATETSRGFGHTQEATEGQTDKKGSKEVKANVFRGEMFHCETNWR